METPSNHSSNSVNPALLLTCLVAIGGVGLSQLQRQELQRENWSLEDANSDLKRKNERQKKEIEWLKAEVVQEQEATRERISWIQDRHDESIQFYDNIIAGWQGVADLEEKLCDREKESDRYAYETKLDAHQRRLEREKEWSAFKDEKAKVIEYGILKEHGTCGPEEGKVYAEMVSWLKANEPKIRKGIVAQCAARTDWDCPDELMASTDIFQGLESAKVFCPTRQTLNTLVPLGGGLISGMTYPADSLPGLKEGAFSMENELLEFDFYRCEGIDTIAHEYVGHLRWGTVHELGADFKVNRDDWIYEVGNIAKAQCKASQGD